MNHGGKNMFREMRRKKQQVSKDACIDILSQEKRGALAVNGEDGYPYVVPVNFYYDEPTETLYFHGAKTGHKIDSIQKNPKVCFTVWTSGTRKEGDWAYYVSSVVVFGTASLVTDSDLLREKLRVIGLKYYPTAEEVDQVMHRTLGNVQMIAVHVDHMTGKLVHEK